MMLNLSAALGRLVLSGRELARLSGFSSRVTGLIDVIDDVNRGVYKRGQQPTAPAPVSSPPAAAASTVARSGSVLVNEASVIEFTDVPLVTPTGEVLVEALSFKVRA
ncbi:unnamed protein product, partial [Hapterophycus canaliculatus]